MPVPPCATARGRTILSRAERRARSGLLRAERAEPNGQAPKPLRTPRAPSYTQCPSPHMPWLSHGLALPRPWLSLALALPCASSPTAWVSHALALPRPWLSLALALPCPKTRIKILILGRGRRAATRSCRPVLHPAAPYLHPATPVPPLTPCCPLPPPAARSKFEPRRWQRTCESDFTRSAVTIRTSKRKTTLREGFSPLSGHNSNRAFGKERVGRILPAECLPDTGLAGKRGGERPRGRRRHTEVRQASSRGRGLLRSMVSVAQPGRATRWPPQALPAPFPAAAPEPQN